MARTKAVLVNGARLTDLLSTSLLARVYPSSLIGQLLDARKCNVQRQCSFPATAVVYYCMALNVYPEAAYGDVFDAVAQGLAWRCRSAAPASIEAPSITVALARLSWPIFKGLQERACQPMALATTCPNAFYRGLRLMAIDGSNFEIPHEPQNTTAFGYPGSRTGVAGYPQAQCAATRTSSVPIRGLSPQRTRDCVGVGLTKCWRKRPRCCASAAGTHQSENGEKAKFTQCEP